MRKPTLHCIIIGFSSVQHSALVQNIKSTHAPLRVNEVSFKPDVFDLFLKRSSVDVVFLKYNSKANFQPLFAKLRSNNKDCIVIELVDPASNVLNENGAPLSAAIQKCRLTHSSSLREFHLSLQFVMQYVILKKDFRRCKSLLHLSETRALKLVDSSNYAIAFIYKGKFIHANIPFLVMFSAESIDELKRFSLSKLIDQDEHVVFAKYLMNVTNAPAFNADLVLSMRRTSGAPFNAKIQVSQVVVNGHSCYQMWIEQRTQDLKEEVIPVTKTLNIWDMPVDQEGKVETYPFDHTLEKDLQGDTESEDSLDVLQRELLSNDLVKLRFRELHDPRNLLLNSVWVKLDVEPDNFRMVNVLLSRNAVLASEAFTNFWDHLTFKLVLESLRLEALSKRNYLVTLSNNSMMNQEMMLWFFKQLKALGKASKQLTLVIDAEMPMNRIPQAQRMVNLLQKTGCYIALNNFSVDTTPLFLFKNMKPSQVILDSQWMDEIKNKNDNGLFIKRFVKKLESLGVSVLIPQIRQKDQDRLFVLTGTSIGQEMSTQRCI